MRPVVILKPLEFNGCDRKKLRMDQQHCSYFAMLTNDRVKRRKPVQNKNIPKGASCLRQGTKVILQKMWQRNVIICPVYKVLYLGQTQHIT
jgi:hypothetical protein